MHPVQNETRKTPIVTPPALAPGYASGAGQSQDNTALVVVNEHHEVSYMPAMSIEIALARRTAVVAFVTQLMEQDQDYGVIPGTKKPTLLKPGAEKLCSFFGLEPEFTPISVVTDWTGDSHHGEPFFYFGYRCRLLRDGRVLGVGEGSCNSWESRYRYRWMPEDQVPAGIEKGKLQTRGGRISEFTFAIDKAETSGQYGKPAAYWEQFKSAIEAGSATAIQKKTKDGREYDAWEIDSRVYRVPNADAADIVNTIQKMAQKRALIAATLIATSASEFFTQDVEDVPVAEGRPRDGSLTPTEEAEHQGYRHVQERKQTPTRTIDVKPATATGPRKAAASSDDDQPVSVPQMNTDFPKLQEQLGPVRWSEELKNAGADHLSKITSLRTKIQFYKRVRAIAGSLSVEAVA